MTDAIKLRTRRRWEAIIKVSMLIETNPKEMWNFISKWGRWHDENVRIAIATLVFEHFLEFHFAEYFLLSRSSGDKACIACLVGWVCW